MAKLSQREAAKRAAAERRRKPAGEGTAFVELARSMLLSELFRLHAEAVLRRERGHRGRTAQALGIDRRTLSKVLAGKLAFARDD